MRIFVSGSLAYDRIMDFPGRFVDHILPEKIHILNVCFMVNGLTERFGGTAGNIAYNLALLGEKPVIVATAGRDFGPYRERLVQLGLPLTPSKYSLASPTVYKEPVTTIWSSGPARDWACWTAAATRGVWRISRP